MKKNHIPTLLIVIGFLILLSAVGIFLYPRITDNLNKEILPQNLGGLPLTRATYGPEAVSSVIQLHGVDFPMDDAAIGYYGSEGEITVWVSVEPDQQTAAELNDLMTEKINLGRSPFTMPVIEKFGSTPVYVLEGLGQQHYYWQADNLIIWLAANFDIAANVLAESLSYYR